MYNIGINLVNEKFENTYVNTINKSECNLSLVDEKDIEEVIDDLDGVVLKENTSQNIGEICELIIKIKKMSNSFIWIFCDEPVDVQKIIYLQLGADGIFTKDNSPEEMSLSMNNSLKRYQKINTIEDICEEKEEGGLKLINHNLSVRPSGRSEEIPLTRLEFQLMRLLYENHSKGVSYKDIYEEIWQAPYENNKYKYKVANLVFHLRVKLENGGAKPSIIRTVRSKGYMLSES
ncbi:response regulator transcription factor [Enterococcus sp. BWM-S5]|uniref:Response regulator transcription factor n=1 Tax=Enterococcus larvae TaxID=2794352 RepID=A0ABS4CN05_9ENTE|nr:winged helix-turn-helix domain-containing protein [Enterococcus larvae]MBP1047878.1 response regulator transcription factor [Enterococcus larvae]